MLRVPAGTEISAIFTQPSSTAGAISEPFEPFFTEIVSTTFFFVLMCSKVLTFVSGSINARLCSSKPTSEIATCTMSLRSSVSSAASTETGLVISVSIPTSSFASQYASKPSTCTFIPPFVYGATEPPRMKLCPLPDTIVFSTSAMFLYCWS